MIKTISLFHSTQGHLGTWTEPVVNKAQVVFSIAYLCPVCGEVWLRRVQQIDGVQNRWTSWSRECNIHNGGQAITGGDAHDFSNMSALPTTLLIYEFNNELSKMENKK